MFKPLNPCWLRAPTSLSVPCLFSVDILKNIIREYRDAYSEIIKRADRTLQEVGAGGKGKVLGGLTLGLTLVLPQVFGLQLVEIDAKRHIYILINNLPCAEGEHLCR